MGRALLFTVCVLLVLVFCWCAGLFGSYATWYAPGPIQVIAGPNEAWCFVQINRIVHRRGPLAEPPNITVGHVQEVVILTPDGIKERIPVSVTDGVTFHPNSSTIFRLGNDFYLSEAEGFSMITLRPVYIWQNNHFELLPPAEKDALVRAEQLDNLEPIEAEQLPRPNEWRRVFHDSGWFLPGRFEWNGLPFEIGDVEENKLARLEIRRLSESGWEAELIRYDATRRRLSGTEHAALWKQPEQRIHRRPQ